MNVDIPLSKQKTAVECADCLSPWIALDMTLNYLICVTLDAELLGM